MSHEDAATLKEVIESVVEGLGFELVTVERGGGKKRPLLRLRIDRPDSDPGRSSVTVDDCAAVSRAVHERLGEAAPRYIVEVSSPGVNRPLAKPSDYDRFAGQPVTVRGYAPLREGRRVLEGRLVGRTEDGLRAILEVEGARTEIPLAAIAKANLVFQWEVERR